MSSGSFDCGYREKKPLVRTKSKDCTTKVRKEIHRANVSPKKYILDSCTTKDCSLVTEGECSSKVSNDKVIMPKIDK